MSSRWRPPDPRERYQDDGEELQKSAPRILLAEDDREMRRVLALSLRKEGYEVIEAEDGFELLDYLSSPPILHGRVTPFDLVVSDVRMPVFTGLDALAYLRDSDWKTPLVLITAFGDERTHAEARELGAAAVFDKPFQIDDLKRTVAGILPAR